LTMPGMFSRFPACNIKSVSRGFFGDPLLPAPQALSP